MASSYGPNRTSSCVDEVAQAGEGTATGVAHQPTGAAPFASGRSRRTSPSIVVEGRHRRVGEDRRVLRRWLPVVGVEVPPAADRAVAVHQVAEVGAGPAVEVLHLQAVAPGGPGREVVVVPEELVRPDLLDPTARTAGALPGSSVPWRPDGRVRARRRGPRSPRPSSAPGGGRPRSRPHRSSTANRRIAVMTRWSRWMCRVGRSSASLSTSRTRQSPGPRSARAPMRRLSWSPKTRTVSTPTSQPGVLRERTAAPRRAPGSRRRGRWRPRRGRGATGPPGWTSSPRCRRR